MELDQFDRRILALLQVNNRMPQREISEAVNLSSSAVNRRIAAMEAAGVIMSHTALINPAAVNRPTTVIVQVTLETERLDLLDAARQRFVSHPSVQQVYYVTGEADFVLIVNVADMHEYEQLTRALFFSGGNVKKFQTQVVMGVAKASLSVQV
jgi:Lrp/AsnC family transcriptional regulator, leucine-responsive regulatory protein